MTVFVFGGGEGVFFSPKKKRKGGVSKKGKAIKNRQREREREYVRK